MNFRPEEPYILTSGWASPVYIDCRKLISFPRERRTVVSLAADMLSRDVGKDAFDMVAGGETAGIPYAAWMSEEMDLPMLYVRKKPKGFGRNARIEGDPRDGARVLLVEDLATDGASKISFVDGLREAGMEVSHTFVVFFYGVFAGAEETLGKAGLTLHYLANWHDVVEAAARRKAFSESAISGVKEFLADPKGWSKAHGGK